MRTLRRRIEALERSNCLNLDRQRIIADRAILSLRKDDFEALYTAYKAENLGQRLTDREQAAKPIYTEALNREGRSAGIRPIPGIGLGAAGREKVIGRLLACRMSLEELLLCRSGLIAIDDGRQPNDQESAAMQTCESRMGMSSWPAITPLGRIQPLSGSVR